MILGDGMNNENKFINRLIELRQTKGVSARDMSLSLGQSESYINKIENHKSLPSLTGFFYICEYFQITPMEFFDYETQDPKLAKELVQEMRKLDYLETKHVLDIIKDINKK